MSTPSKSSNDASSPLPAGDPNPPTYASFSPSHLGQTTPQTKLRSAILVHQKSPLLAATPPQITRVLAYSHPFILPLNKFAGLVTWTTGDPWESFLLVASFWAVVMYGDAVTRYAGPIIVVSMLILGMYTRRYSPLSSTGWTGEKGQKGHKRVESDTNITHHKSLEEIVDSLKLFTSRCNILLDPFLRLTDFLSTQRTATSATTRPALTVLFIRILFVLPLWIALTLPPLYILSTKRVVLAVGTVMLSWHSRPARVTRTLLWRSRTVRRTCAFITGLDLGDVISTDRKGAPPLPPRKKSTQEVAASLAAKRRPESTGVRFTFSIYENQRRWLGIGWTSSMLAYERASWTDEHLNSVPPKDQFELPEVEGGPSRWRWVQNSEWKIEGGEKDNIKADKGTSKEDSGWIYYDNKVRPSINPRTSLLKYSLHQWRDGRRGQDGWGRYTRRRKWYRDAELVEATPSTETTPAPTPKPTPIDTSADPDPNHLTKLSSNLSVASSIDPTLVDGEGREYAASITSDTDAASTKSKRSWFKKKRRSKSTGGSVSGVTVVSDSGTGGTRRSEEDDVQSPLERIVREEEWRLGDDIRQHLDI
jgi:hypothetical protein